MVGDDAPSTGDVPTSLGTLARIGARLALVAVIAALSATQKAGFQAGILAASGALLVLATIGLPPLVLRLVRLTSSGTAAVSGTLLSLQLGFIVSTAGGKDESGLGAALMLTLVFAGVAAWTSDLRLAAKDAAAERARDDLAARRHDEVMAALHLAPGARRGVRPSDFVYLLVARALLRR